jgi:hypothetical protein
MEDIRRQATTTTRSTTTIDSEKKSVNINDRLRKVEEDLKYGRMKVDTDENEKPFNYPSKWRRTMNKSNSKAAEDKVLMLYLNIKGEIEPPRLVPLYSGNIIIWKHKAYEFDPRASWITKIKRKIVKCIIIREIDRRPVSNLDWDEVKARGDSTDSDEILVKMVTKAVMEKAKTQINKGVIVVIGIVIAIGVLAFLFWPK